MVLVEDEVKVVDLVLGELLPEAVVEEVLVDRGSLGEEEVFGKQGAHLVQAVKVVEKDWSEKSCVELVKGRVLEKVEGDGLLRVGDDEREELVHLDVVGKG